MSHFQRWFLLFGPNLPILLNANTPNHQPYEMRNLYMLARYNRSLTVVRLTSDASISAPLRAYQEHVAYLVNLGLRALRMALDPDRVSIYWERGYETRTKKLDELAPTKYAERRKVVMNAMSGGRVSDAKVRMAMYADEVLRLWSIGERDDRKPGDPARFTYRTLEVSKPGQIRLLFATNRYFLGIHPLTVSTASRLSGWLCQDRNGHYLELASNATSNQLEPIEELPNSLWSGPNEVWFQNLPPRIQSRLNRLYSDYLRHSMDAANHQDTDTKRAQRQRARCKVIETEIRQLASEFNCPAPFTLPG